MPYYFKRFVSLTTSLYKPFTVFYPYFAYGNPNDSKLSFNLP